MRVRELRLMEEQRNDMARLRANAHQKPRPLAALQAQVRRGGGPGLDASFTAWLPVGYRVVYTVEQQPPTPQAAERGSLGVWCHHLSVSVTQRPAWNHKKETALYPAVGAMLSIMRLAGFRVLDLKACHIYEEPGAAAVNILQPLDPEHPEAGRPDPAWPETPEPEGNWLQKALDSAEQKTTVVVQECKSQAELEAAAVAFRRGQLSQTPDPGESN